MPVYREKDRSKWSKDGRSYYFRCYYTDVYGNRKQERSKLYLSRPAAKKAEDDFLLSVATTNEIDFDISFREVYEEWLLFKKRKLRDVYGITVKLNKNVLEFFKPFKLHSIKINTINKWYLWLSEKEFSPDYENTMIGYLREILDYAKDNYDFDGKVASKVERNKIDKINDKISDAEVNCWSYEEFKKFISVVDDKLWYTIFNFLFFTGLRKGEMFALTWNDIDFDNRQLRINKTLTSKTGTKTYKITPPKTKNSNRIIDLDDDLAEILKSHYETEKSLYNFSNSMFVFGNVKPIAPTTLARKLDYYIDKSEVKRIAPHGFRHSHATLLINLGCNVRDVADRLGDTVEVVETTYYHILPKQRSITVKALNNLER